jgi:hypothetical protein
MGMVTVRVGGYLSGGPRTRPDLCTRGPLALSAFPPARARPLEGRAPAAWERSLASVVDNYVIATSSSIVGVPKVPIATWVEAEFPAPAPDQTFAENWTVK